MQSLQLVLFVQPAATSQSSPLAPAVAGIAFNPADDPLLQRNSDSDTDSEDEAFRIRDDDLLILAARNEDDVSHLEVGRRSEVHWLGFEGASAAAKCIQCRLTGG